MRKRYLSISMLTLVLLAAFLLPACAEPEPEPAPAPAPKPAPKPTPAPPPAEPIKLIFSEFEPPGSYWETEVGAPYCAELEKRTGGKVEIEQHYGGELVGLFDVYDAVLKGTVDMAKILPTMFADKFPMDGIIIFQPVNIKTYRAGQAWLDLYNKYPDMQAQYANTPLLGFAPMPCSGLASTSGVKITKWEDCKGLKAPGAGPAPESRQKAVGIVPVSIPPPDCYMAFKTGTLDVIAMGLMSLKDFGWNDVLPNITMVNINGGPWSYVMNQETWNSLPPDIQGVIKDMIPWLTEINDRVQYQNEQIALDTFPGDYGTNITWLSQEELDRWAEVDTPAMDAYVAEFVTALGMPGDELKNDFISLHKKYAAPEYAFE